MLAGWPEGLGASEELAVIFTPLAPDPSVFIESHYLLDEFTCWVLFLWRTNSRIVVINYK